MCNYCEHLQYKWVETNGRFNDSSQEYDRNDEASSCLEDQNYISAFSNSINLGDGCVRECVSERLDIINFLYIYISILVSVNSFCSQHILTTHLFYILETNDNHRAFRSGYIDESSLTLGWRAHQSVSWEVCCIFLLSYQLHFGYYPSNTHFDRRIGIILRSPKR